MSPTLETLGHLLLQYKYLVLFPIAVVEGPIVTVVAGVTVSLGFLGFWPAYVVIVIADTIGDWLHYVIGRYGGKPFILHWGKYLGLDESHVESLEKVFDGREGRAFLVGKLAHGFGGALLVAAGMIRMDLKKFLYWNVVGTIPKTVVLMALGYYFAHALARIDSVLDVIALVTVALGVAGVGVWLYFHNKNKPSA